MLSAALGAGHPYDLLPTRVMAIYMKARLRTSRWIGSKLPAWYQDRGIILSIENSPADPAAVPECDDPEGKPFALTERTRRLILEAQKKYRHRKRLERRIEFSWLSWLFDEFPSDEMYRPPLGERRNTRQEMAYHRLRQMMSWSFWSGIKSSTGIKLAAVAGLVAGFLQAAPLLKGAEVAVGPLGWLLVSGGFYLLAVLWFECRCPVLLKRTLAGKQEYLGIEGRRWLLALVEDELRRWWSIKPYDLKTGRAQANADTYQVALGMTQYGNIPAYGGFGDYAAARIEHALDEYAQLTSTIIWRDERRQVMLRRFSPGHRYCPLNSPLRSLDLSVMDEAKVKAAEAGKEGDLAIRWFDTPLTFITELPTHRNLTVSTYTEGLAYLFRTDTSALTFTRIVAQWQNTMHPWSRLVLLGLFSASGVCFLWFALQQLRVLAPILL